MISYSDNPNLRLKTVTTIGKKTEYRRSCKFIHGEYHIINQDCHEIDGVWYRVNSGKIELDHELGKWFVLKRGNLQVKGIVALNGDEEVMGYYTPNVYKNIRVNSRVQGKTYAISAEVLKGKYIEDVGTGFYHPKGGMTSTTVRKMSEIRNELSHQNRGYNIEENPDDFKNKMASYKANPIKPDKDIAAYGKLLGDVTFGCEVEIAAGYLAENLQHQTGVVICRDGSIGGGPELVTVPKSGGKGVQSLINLSEFLKTRGTIDINCSMHLHLGTIPTDRDYLASVYVLGHRIQDEIFKMFPYYKTEPAGIKKKNYNQKLDRLGIFPLVDKTKIAYEDYINDIYHKLFVFLAEKVTPGAQFNRKMRKHPISQKWNRHSR